LQHPTLVVYSLSRARDTSSSLFLDVSAGRDASRWSEGGSRWSSSRWGCSSVTPAN